MTLEAILLLIFSFAGANLLGSNFISPYFSHGGGTLIFHLLALVTFLVYVTYGGTRPAAARRRFIILLVGVVLFVGGVTVRQMQLRQPGSLPAGVHDGAVHAEVAAKVFLEGHNPYDFDFRGSDYETVNPPIPGGPKINVVWSHYIYPPLTFLLMTPVVLVAEAFGEEADIRWILVAGLALATWLIVRTTTDWDRRGLLLLLTAGNPFVWLYVVAGYNDVLATTALIATAAAWSRSRWLLAGIALGLAVGLKQSAWLAVPLFLFVLWRLWPSNRVGAKRSLAGFILIGAITYLPFIAWNAPALYDDVVRYASGAIPYSYPISGATFLQYLNIFRLIPSPWAVIPTFWWQLAIGLPVFVGLVLWLRKRIEPAAWLTSVVVFTLATLLFSRYVNNNYLSALMLLAVSAYAYRVPAHEQ